MQTPELSGSKPRLALTGKRGKDQIVAMLTALSALGIVRKGIQYRFQYVAYPIALQADDD